MSEANATPQANTPAKKSKAKNKPSTVSVATQTTTVITVGSDNYLLKGTSDGRGLRIENATNSLFIPYGDAGKAIAEQISALVSNGVVRKRRRTKAELALDAQ